MDVVEKDRQDAKVVAHYQARYRRQDQAVRLFDRVLGVVTRWLTPTPAVRVAKPRRILLVNAGHLGDVIMSTGLLPALHHAFPGVEVGFLTGSYSRGIVEGHPLIAQCHFIDHWYLSRKAAPRWRRFMIYLTTLPGMVRELRGVGYDVAIDVRCWFPNLVPLIWMAGIPVRIAYGRLGFAFLLTHPMEYVYERRHEFDYQVALLRRLNVPEGSLGKAWPTLSPPSDVAVREARTVVGDNARYRVLHPMASTPTRDWGLEKWQALAQDLLARGIRPVITGSGPREKAAADIICRGATGSINAVDALSWSGLIALIEQAEAVYAVETSIGHAAAALRVPVISVYGGMADPAHWAPLGAVVATNLTACHPCLIKAGCATRECLSGISVKDVQDAAAIALLEQPREARDHVSPRESDASDQQQPGK